MFIINRAVISPFRRRLTSITLQGHPTLTLNLSSLIPPPHPFIPTTQWTFLGTSSFPTPLAVTLHVGQSDRLRPEQPCQAQIDPYNPFLPSPPPSPLSSQMPPLPPMITTSFLKYPNRNVVGASPALCHVLRASLCAAKIIPVSRRPGAPKSTTPSPPYGI